MKERHPTPEENKQDIIDFQKIKGALSDLAKIREHATEYDAQGTLDFVNEIEPIAKYLHRKYYIRLYSLDE